MASALTWLDFSEDDQRRAREIVQLFTQRESRDELGLGVVRDALSEQLFPGISVIQTRARYFLFIPWLFQVGGRRGHQGRALVKWLDGRERELIETLITGGDFDGLIGQNARSKLKILPSTIYWGGLQRFGILRHSGYIDDVAAAVGAVPTLEEAMTEQVGRAVTIWDPNMPPPPPGFPRLESIDFVMPKAEGDWLAERIVDSTAGTALSYLAAQSAVPSDTADGPWAEPLLAFAPEETRAVVTQAKLFSLALHGAALLYNLLLAERCVALEFSDDGNRVDDYEERLHEWEKKIEATSAELGAWNVSDLWALVYERNGRVPVKARMFVDSWIGAVRSGAMTDVARNDVLRDAVAGREVDLKRGQSRLTNDRLLNQWGGDSGADPLTYRWPTVRRLLRDISAAKARHVAA